MQTSQPLHATRDANVQIGLGNKAKQSVHIYAPFLENSTPFHRRVQRRAGDVLRAPIPCALWSPGRLTATRPDLRPVVIERQGTLASRERVTVDFGLLGPNRSVRLDGVFPAGGVGHVEVTCDDATRRRRGLTSSRPVVTLELPRVGPTQCRASIVNAGSETERFRFTVRLSIRR